MILYTKEDFPGATWLEDPLKCRYVRETNYSAGGTAGTPKEIRDFFKYNKEWKLIGFTKPTGPRYYYEGTFFWLKDYDAGMSNCESAGHYNVDGQPSEAVKFVSLEEKDKIEIEDPENELWDEKIWEMKQRLYARLIVGMIKKEEYEVLLQKLHNKEMLLVIENETK
jgi:hypothetical protein